MDFCKLPKSARSVFLFYSMEYTITRFVWSFLGICLCSMYESTPLNHFRFFLDTLPLAIRLKNLHRQNLLRDLDPNKSPSLHYFFVTLIRNLIILHRFITLSSLQMTELRTLYLLKIRMPPLFSKRSSSLTLSGILKTNVYYIN